MKNCVLPFRYPDTHRCDTLLVMCMDFRFRKKTIRFVQEHLEIQAFDQLAVPGSVKTILEKRGTVKEAMEVSAHLHEIDRFILVNHQDCGAYGGSKNFDDADAEQKFHETELRAARDRIRGYYPDKTVMLFYARLINGKKDIEFIPIY